MTRKKSGDWTIYVHTNRVNGKKYVGLTRAPTATRWREHVSDALYERRPYKFHCAIRKYGPEAFDHDTLEICPTLASANESESWWIAHFGSDDRALGYNLDAGGNCKVTHDESRARQSDSQRKRFANQSEREKLSLAHKTSLSCQAHLQRVHEARRGTKASPETRAKMREAQRQRREREAAGRTSDAQLTEHEHA